MTPGPMPAPQPSGPPPLTIDAVVQLLRDDEMRGFRIDVETDSMIEPDRQAEQASRNELTTAVTGFLVQVLPIVQVMPQLAPMVSALLLFSVRAYKVGQELEDVIEKSMADVQQALAQPKQPPPPSPDEQVKLQATQIKAQAEGVKAQMSVQEAALAAQAKAAQAQQALDHRQHEHLIAMAEMERQRAAEREAHAMELQRAAEAHRMEMEQARQAHALALEQSREQAKHAADAAKAKAKDGE